LRLIFDGQHRLFRTLNELKLKLDNVGGTTGGGGVASDDIRRLQKDLGSISNTINHVYTVANEQKTILREIQNRVVQMQTGRVPSVAQNAQATAASGGAPSLDPAVRNDIATMKQDVTSIKQSIFKIPTDCPKVISQPSRANSGDSESANCVGNTTFVVFAVLQMTLMGVYIYFQRQKEQSAKKFF